MRSRLLFHALSRNLNETDLLTGVAFERQVGAVIDLIKRTPGIKPYVVSIFPTRGDSEAFNRVREALENAE